MRASILTILSLFLVACGDDAGSEMDRPSSDIAQVLVERAKTSIRESIRDDIAFPDEWLNVMDVSDQLGKGTWTVSGIGKLGAREEEVEYYAAFVLSSREAAAASTARIKVLKLDGMDLLDGR